MDKNKRFKMKYSQFLKGGGIIKIIIDNKTGVNYLISSGFSINGITPLIDIDGKPLKE